MGASTFAQDAGLPAEIQHLEICHVSRCHYDVVLTVDGQLPITAPYSADRSTSVPITIQ